MSKKINSLSQSRETQLLEEYHVNIELWKHDDILRQQRTSNFLTINTILFIALTTFINADHSFWILALIVSILASFGLVMSLIWNSVHIRNAEYIRLRRFQLRYIESQLLNITTITNTYNALYRHKTIPFSEINDSFRCKSKTSSTLSESRLPIIMASTWVLVLACNIVFIFLNAW